MLDESIQSLVAQINEGAVSPSSVMPSSDSPEPTIESAAPPTPPEETNEQRARRLAKKHGVDPKLVVSMMAQESQGKTKARSWKDARGPMQLMPETAKALGVTDIYDPEQNIEAGVKYLKYGLDKYGRTPDGIKKAIAGYNLGMDKKVLRDPDWWNKISKYSNTEGITGTPMSNPARGLHDRGSTGNYVKNIWSNYMKGGAPTQVNYKLLSLDEVVKRYHPQKSEPKAGPKVEVAGSTGYSGREYFDPSTLTGSTAAKPSAALPSLDDLVDLTKNSTATEVAATDTGQTDEYTQYLAQTGQVANPSGQTEYDGLPPIGGRKSTTKAQKTQPVTKEPTLADVNKSLKAEGKKPITQEQLTKQVKENESFGSDVTVGYSGGTPVDDSGDPLPVPIDGPIEVKTDEDILANGTRTIKMDPDTDKDQAFDNALHSIGAEYDLPSSQVEGFIAKRRAAGKTVQYDLTTEERAALKASGKQMGVTVDYGTINDLLNFGRTEPDKIHPKLRQTVDMYTAENRAPKIDLNLPEMNEPKGFINKLRGISPEQERTENMQSDPLYQQAKDNLYREKGFEPNRTLEGSYDLLGAPALDEREIQDEYMRLQSTEKLLDEEAIRRGQERGATMGASEGGWAGSFSAGLNTSAGLVQVLNQLGGGGAENNVTRYLRRLGKETGAAASVESEKNTGGWDTVNRFITGLPIGLTKAMMLVPTANGSTSIAFGSEAGLGESGRGGSGTDVLRETAKGFAMGALFPAGRKLGSIAGGGKAGALVDIGTVTAGTAAISGAGGASPEEAGKAGIENAILDVLMRVARMRKSGGKWYDSGEADLDSVKNKIYRYTPNPREIGIVDGGLTRAANIAGVPENHVYFTVKADGSVVVINQPPPKTKVTYIKKAPTQAELESMLRKQVEALGKETTQPSQAGPAMSEPIRSVVPIPGSEPMVVNAEPIPKIVMGGKADPIPESQAAIDAQTAAAADPSQTKRIAVMFPKGTKAPKPTAEQWKTVDSAGNIILVNKSQWLEKARGMGVVGVRKARLELDKFVQSDVNVQSLLGRPESAVVESTEAMPGRAAVEATQDGKQIDATVVDTEQAAAETVDSMEQQYPGAEVEVKDSTEVAENRIADTSARQEGEGLVPWFERVTQRSPEPPEMQQLMDGKTPEEILAGPVTKLPPRQETQISMLIDRFKQETGREPTESELFQMSMGDHPDGIIARAKAAGGPVGAYRPGDTVIYTDKKGNQLKAEVVRDNDLLAQTRIRLYKKDGTIGTREVKVGHADIERVDTPDAPKLSGAIVPEILPPEISQPKVETKVNQEPAKVEPESKPVEQPKHRHDEAIAEHKSDIEFNEDQMLAEQENIEMIEGDIPEARAARDAEIKKIRASKLPKEAKEDAIEDAKGKYQDIKDDTESQIEGHKEEISAYKKEIAKSKRKLAKLETERSKELAEPSSESPKAEDTSDTRDPVHVQSDADLAEYMATRTVSDEPHVGMLNSGIEVQLEAYIRPATKDGVQLKNKQGEPLLEGSLVQTRTSNGESSYIGDRVLGTDRADILRQVDNKRLEYQHEHGQEGTFIPKSEVPEKVESEPAGPMKEGDEVMTPDGPGEFLRTSGKKSVIVEVGREEKTYLASLVKPDTGKDWGKNNTFFTKENNDIVSQKLKVALAAAERTARIGFDPELLSLAIQRAGFHIESGARTFVDMSTRMVAELGEAIRPYLRAAYQAVRDMPGFDNDGMDRDLPSNDGDGINRVRDSVRNMEATGVIARDEITGNHRYYNEKSNDPQVQSSRAIIEHIGIDAAVESSMQMRENLTTEDASFQAQTIIALRRLSSEATRAGANVLARHYADQLRDLVNVFNSWGTENARLQQIRRTAYADPAAAAVAEAEIYRQRLGLGRLTAEERVALESAAEAFNEAQRRVAMANAAYDADPNEITNANRQAALDNQQKAHDYLDALSRKLKSEHDSIFKKTAQLLKMAMVSAITTAANNMASASATRGILNLRDIIDLGVKKLDAKVEGTFLSGLVPNASLHGEIPVRNETVFYNGQEGKVIKVDSDARTVKLYINGRSREVNISDVTRQPEGLSASTRWSDVLGVPVGQNGGFVEYFREIAMADPIIRAAIREYPELYNELYGDYQSDISSISQVREDPGGIVHKSLDAGIYVYDKANWFNRKQEYYNRNLQVMHSLQVRLGARGLNIADMNSVKDFRQVTKEDWAYAIQEARRASFAMSPDPGTIAGKFISKTRGSMALPAAFTVPFANFSWNVFNMATDFMPVLAQVKSGKAVYKRGVKGGLSKSEAIRNVFTPSKYTSTELANSLVGFGLLATAYGMAGQLGDKKEWYLWRMPLTTGMSDDGKSSLYLDLRQHPQFSPFVYVASKMRRLANGEQLFEYSNPKDIAAELVESFANLSYRSSIDNNAALNTAYYSIAALYDKSTTGTITNRADEKAMYSLFQLMGNYTGVFLQPGKPLKFLVDSALGTPDKDFEKHPFLQSFGRNLPKYMFGANGFAPVEDKENPATGEKKFRRFEPLKILGATVVDGGTVSDKLTPGEQMARSLAGQGFASERPFLPDDKFVAEIKREMEKESDLRRATGDSSGLDALKDRVKNYVAAGTLTQDDADSINKVMVTSDIQENFSRISVVPKRGHDYSDAELLWSKLSESERELLKDDMTKKIGTALVDGKITDTYAQKLGKFADSSTISAVKEIGTMSAIEERKEQEIIDTVKSGDSTVLDSLPLKDRKKILKATKTSDFVQDFIGMGIPNRAFFFGNQGVDKQAELLPYMEKASKSLLKKTSQSDQLTSKEMIRVMDEYHKKLGMLSTAEQGRLKAITEEARKVLGPSSTALPSLDNIKIPGFGLPVF